MEARVSDLIDEELHCWKNEVVNQEFLPHEAKVILAMPLSIFPTPNTQLWPDLKNGSFSTKRAYHLLVKFENAKMSTCPNQVKNHSLWKGIWSLEVPHKVCHFL